MKVNLGRSVPTLKSPSHGLIESSNHMSSIQYKIGDQVTVLPSSDVAKKWHGKTLTVTLVGPKRLYLDNPDHPGVKLQSVWPRIADVALADANA